MALSKNQVRAMDDVTLCFIDSSAAVMPILLPEAVVSRGSSLDDVYFDHLLVMT